MAQASPVVLLSFTNGSKIDETNFAQKAEQFVSKAGKDGKRTLAFEKLTTTKLRSIYSLILNTQAKIDDPDDFDNHIKDIQYLKIRMAYEAGREDAVRTFLKETHLMTAIDRVKTYEQFMLFCLYAESLVAYFKYYGGKDK